MQVPFNLRIVDGVTRDAIEAAARADGRSVNSWINKVIQEALRREESDSAARQ